MKKYIMIFSLFTLIGYWFLPKDTDLTDKLPMITSHTTLDAEYLEGGLTCFQFTTVVPDKFSAKTRMECEK